MTTLATKLSDAVEALKGLDLIARLQGIDLGILQDALDAVNLDEVLGSLGDLVGGGVVGTVLDLVLEDGSTFRMIYDAVSEAYADRKISPDEADALAIELGMPLVAAWELPDVHLNDTEIFGNHARDRFREARDLGAEPFLGGCGRVARKLAIAATA